VLAAEHRVGEVVAHDDVDSRDAAFSSLARLAFEAASMILLLSEPQQGAAAARLAEHATAGGNAILRAFGLIRRHGAFFVAMPSSRDIF
jgi:hypothetical protein